MWFKNGIRGRGPDLIHAGVAYIFDDSRPSRRRQSCPVFLQALLGALPSTGSTTHRVTGLAHAFPPMKLLLKEALQWMDALAKPSNKSCRMTVLSGLRQRAVAQKVEPLRSRDALKPREASFHCIGRF